MFINQLAVGVKNLNLGIEIGGKKLSILLYADDIVLMRKSEENLLKIVDYFQKCCKKWMLKFNEDKSNVVHFRKTRKRCTLFQFQCGNCFLKTVLHYTYLGIPFDEHLTFVHCIKNRTCAA